MRLATILRVLMTRSLRPFVFTNGNEKTLNFSEVKDLGLYIHIPFCSKLCGFCPYCKELYSREKAELYKRALLKEIDLVCAGNLLKKEVTSLYFGGGTPALMIDDFEEIINHLQNYFDIGNGIGVELHPDNLSETNLQKLIAAGITMISVGVQSFNAKCLQRLGRMDNLNLGELDLIKGKGFNVVDFDLIFAIPGQTADTLENDLITAFELGATQVSTYPFIEFSYTDHQYLPPSEKIKKNLLQTLVRCSRKYNYARTSIWTFAKSNTKKYSSVTREAYLGFGLSATTLLDRSFKINTQSLNGYLERTEEGKLPTALTTYFNRRQRAVFYLFWCAYNLRVNKKSFERLFGLPLNRMFGPDLFIAKMLGLIQEEGEQFELTERGAYWFHYIEQIYTRSYIDKMWNILRNQAFPERIVL